MGGRGKEVELEPVTKITQLGEEGRGHAEDMSSNMIHPWHESKHSGFHLLFLFELMFLVCLWKKYKT